MTVALTQFQDNAALANDTQLADLLWGASGIFDMGAVARVAVNQFGCGEGGGGALCVYCSR